MIFIFLTTNKPRNSVPIISEIGSTGAEKGEKDNRETASIT